MRSRGETQSTTVKLVTDPEKPGFWALLEISMSQTH